MSRLLLEIGSRHGGFIETLARRNPTDECLGVEYRGIWVRDAREKAKRRGIQNIRYLCLDARMVVAHLLGAQEASEVYVLFPDPWPKKRHRRRRLLQASFLSQLARVMKPGAALFVLTDVAAYADFVREEAARVPELRPLPQDRWPDEALWGPTRRERVTHLLEGKVERVFLERCTQHHEPLGKSMSSPRQRP